jgi:hypothetical protein
VFVTNHFKDSALAAFESDCPRYNSLSSNTSANNGKITVPLVQRFLDDASIRRINIQAIVVEPARNKLYLSMNNVPASDGPYIEIDAARLFAE